MVVETSTLVMVTIWNLMMWTCTVVISKTMSLTSVIYKNTTYQHSKLYKILCLFYYRDTR
jgi:hypothetical protein